MFGLPLTYKPASVKFSMLGRLSTSSSEDGTITKMARERLVKELYVCNNIFLTIFVPLAVYR